MDGHTKEGVTVERLDQQRRQGLRLGHVLAVLPEARQSVITAALNVERNEVGTDLLIQLEEFLSDGIGKAFVQGLASRLAFRREHASQERVDPTFVPNAHRRVKTFDHLQMTLTGKKFKYGASSSDNQTKEKFSTVTESQKPRSIRARTRKQAAQSTVGQCQVVLRHRIICNTFQLGSE